MSNGFQQEFDFGVELKSVEDINRFLQAADEYLVQGRRHAMVIAVAHMEIFRKFPQMTFADLEQRYRDMNSETYLLAAPKDNLPAELDVRHPITGKPTTYFIWIEVNGRGAARTKRAEFGIQDALDNLERLRMDCGVLTQRMFVQ